MLFVHYTGTFWQIHIGLCFRSKNEQLWRELFWYFRLQRSVSQSSSKYAFYFILCTTIFTKMPDEICFPLFLKMNSDSFLCCVLKQNTLEEMTPSSNWRKLQIFCFYFFSTLIEVQKNDNVRKIENSLNYLCNILFPVFRFSRAFNWFGMLLLWYLSIHICKAIN